MEDCLSWLFSAVLNEETLQRDIEKHTILRMDRKMLAARIERRSFLKTKSIKHAL